MMKRLKRTQGGSRTYKISDHPPDARVHPNINMEGQWVVWWDQESEITLGWRLVREPTPQRLKIKTLKCIKMQYLYIFIYVHSWQTNFWHLKFLFRIWVITEITLEGMLPLWRGRVGEFPHWCSYIFKPSAFKQGQQWICSRMFQTFSTRIEYSRSFDSELLDLNHFSAQLRLELAVSLKKQDLKVRLAT